MGIDTLLGAKMYQLYLHLRLILLPVLLLTAVMLLIRAQPYDDQQLRQALVSTGCPAPCFMGIRPGVTRSKEAMTLLKAHSWVADITAINSENPYQIWWTWDSHAPVFLKSEPITPTFPVNGVVDSNSEFVSDIRFSPQLTLGDIVLAMGLPPAAQFIFGGIIFAPSRDVTAIITFEYPAVGFWASATLECPYESSLWNAPAQLTITNDFNGLSLGTIRPIDRKTFLNSIRQTSNLMCGL